MDHPMCDKTGRLEEEKELEIDNKMDIDEIDDDHDNRMVVMEEEFKEVQIGFGCWRCWICRAVELSIFCV